MVAEKFIAGMNIGAFSCLIFAVVFAVLAAVFAILKEKAAVLISGFNSLPKEERKKYDTAKLSSDTRNSFILWAAVFAVGAVLSYFVNEYCAFLAFAVWLVLFFRNVHFDTDKAFEKYKL